MELAFGRSLSAVLATALTTGIAPVVVAADGVNNALRFDPDLESVVEIGAYEGLGLDEWTIEAWFLIDGNSVKEKTGFWGTKIAPIVAKGIDTDQDGLETDINYTVGIGTGDHLTADLEGVHIFELQNGLPSGANHPVRGETPVLRHGWHHAAFVYDGATWRVYLDGQLNAWTQAELIPRSNSVHPVAFGAALGVNGDKEGFFHGIIDEVRIWNHARTAAEIRADVNREIEAAPGLVGRWGLNEESGTTVFDSSGNDHHGEAFATERVPGAPFDIDLSPEIPALVAPPDGSEVETNTATLRVVVEDPETPGLDVTISGRPLAAPREDAFTIVVLPDTQFYTHFDGLDWIFRSMTQYAVDEVIPRNVELVVHVGDLVNRDLVPQWIEAEEAMTTLEDVPLLPYIMGVGNHDETPQGDPCGTQLFNMYFPFDRFKAMPWYGGHHGKDNDNSYVLFSVGDVDYIAVSLEFAARPEAIEWADGIFKQYADRRAILVTHFTLTPFFHGVISATPRPIWEGVKDNPNLFMVLSGHVWGEGHRIEMVDGRPVAMIVTNYQERFLGGNGYLRLIELAPGDDAIHVRTWSPTLETFELDWDSEFWLYEDEPGGPWTELATFEDVPSGGEVEWTWSGLTDGQTYEWQVEVTDGGRTETGPIWSFDVEFGPGDATGDGIVDFNDVLAVLSAWGTDDANADVNDDGIVDLDDLLLVISNWT